MLFHPTPFLPIFPNVRITNKFMLVLAFFLTIAGIVHGEDEMYFNDSENDVGMTIFRCDGVYLAYLDNQKSGSVSI